jgi:hypothetical protein
MEQLIQVKEHLLALALQAVLPPGLPRMDRLAMVREHRMSI